MDLFQWSGNIWTTAYMKSLKVNEKMAQLNLSLTPNLSDRFSRSWTT